MALAELWDYWRAGGDSRLRKQGYADSGMGLLERYRRVPGYWAPHLAHNQDNLRAIEARLGAERGGTLLVLGAGRLLDVPWESLFPHFQRVVLCDADACAVPYIQRLLATAPKAPGCEPVFETGDVTESVVDVAAWSEQAIEAANSPASAARALADGFDRAGTPQPAWARTYADVRAAISTNLLSQLGYFPWEYIQRVFGKRFKADFDAFEDAAERLELYFDRVRARHIQALAAFRKAWVYLSTDIRIYTYSLNGEAPRNLAGEPAPADGGVTLGSDLIPRFRWPVDVLEEWSPLHTQCVQNLWPAGAPLEKPERWAWHIVPQGCDKRHHGHGRVHVVEAWTKRPDG